MHGAGEKEPRGAVTGAENAGAAEAGHGRGPQGTFRRRGFGPRKAFYLVAFALLDLFPVSFYGENLKERARSVMASVRECSASFLNILTLFVAILTILVVAAIYLGATEWLRTNINENPLARRITLSKGPSGTIDFSRNVSAWLDGTGPSELREDDRVYDTRVFSPAEIGYLREQLDKETWEDVTEFQVTGAYGWNEQLLWFQDANGADDSRGYTNGQTVEKTDQLLQSLDLLYSAALGDQRVEFSGDGTGEVIVTERLLNHLGYSVPGAGESLDLTIKYEITLSDETLPRSEPVRVIAVSRTLPQGEFLLTEEFSRKIAARSWYPTKFYREIDFVMAAANEEFAEKAGANAEFFRRNGLTEPDFNSEGKRMTLRRADDQTPWSRVRWETFLADVQRFLSLPEEGEVDFGNPIKPRASERRFGGFLSASLDVSQIEEVPPVADLLYGLGFRVDNSTRNQAELLIRLSGFGRQLLIAIITIVGVLSAISIGLSFAQNIQRKTKEIGVFRAFGASKFTVVAVYCVEAVIVWIIAFTLAAGLSGALAQRISAQIVEVVNLEQGASIVGFTPEIFWLTGGLTLAVCVVVVALASFSALRQEPAEAVRSL